VPSEDQLAWGCCQHACPPPPTGPCASDAKAFAKDVGVGEGRVAAALSTRIQELKQGNAVGTYVREQEQRGFPPASATLCSPAVPRAHLYKKLHCTPGRKVGAKCVKELLDFKMDRGSAINKDVPLGEQQPLLHGCTASMLNKYTSM